MKVVLPDNSELELPDGATGLDAARAIGPKLAEQAVLVRSNGSIQDLRAPLEEGQEIQILTTRDTHDPDALYVLRHSTAHLLAEAVRRRVAQHVERVRVVRIPRGQDLNLLALLERRPQVLDAPVRAHQDGLLSELRPDCARGVEARRAVRKFKFGVVGKDDLHGRAGY